MEEIKKVEKDKEIKRIDLTPEQLKHLGFLKGEIQIAEHRLQAHRETAIKFLNLCAVELEISDGWTFDEKSNAFVLSSKIK